MPIEVGSNSTRCIWKAYEFVILITLLTPFFAKRGQKLDINFQLQEPSCFDFGVKINPRIFHGDVLGIVQEKYPWEYPKISVAVSDMHIFDLNAATNVCPSFHLHCSKSIRPSQKLKISTY